MPQHSHKVGPERPERRRVTVMCGAAALRSDVVLPFKSGWQGKASCRRFSGFDEGGTCRRSVGAVWCGLVRLFLSPVVAQIPWTHLLIWIVSSALLLSSGVPMSCMGSSQSTSASLRLSFAFFDGVTSLGGPICGRRTFEVQFCLLWLSTLIASKRAPNSEGEMLQLLGSLLQRLLVVALEGRATGSNGR